MYPVNLNLEGKKCLVVGGGGVAERKVASLVESGAKVTVIAPSVLTSLNNLAGEGKITLIDDIYKSGMAKGYFLAIVATDDENANKLAISEAKSFGALVNAPTTPEFSDFTVPAVINRGDLTVAVSTNGISPALSRKIKEEISEFLPKNIGGWLKIIKNIRKEAKSKLASSKDRENFWRRALNKKVLRLLKEGRIKEAEAELKTWLFS